MEGIHDARALQHQDHKLKYLFLNLICKLKMHLRMQGPAKNWEKVLLSLGVAGSQPGIEGEEIAPLAKENVAAP